jgi:hypothetical protein
MRDRVADRKFLLQKKVENRIENALGHKFRSGYAMVCYGGAGNVSYRNAYILSRVQVRRQGRVQCAVVLCCVLLWGVVWCGCARAPYENGVS